MSDDLDFGPTIRGLQPGITVFNRYRLERMLGRGGMGVVWLAEDRDLDLRVALKFLPESVVGDTEAVADLKRETRRSLQLTHANIVRIYDFMSDGHAAAISMEYVEGKTLTELKLEQPERCFAPEALMAWLEQLVGALRYAHEKVGIVHRDLKPANLMITKDGELKVADFGISSHLSDSHSRLSGAAGRAAGTLVYMSPQQFAGDKPTVADDIYALGATLYELLTGKPPFFRGSIEHQLQNEEPPRMSERREEFGVQNAAEIPARWEETIAACLEKDAAKRPATVREVFRRLTEPPAAVAEAPPPGSHPIHAAAPDSAAQPGAPPPQDSRGKGRRKQTLAVAAGAAAAVVIGVPIWWTMNRSDGKPGAGSAATAGDPVTEGAAEVETELAAKLRTASKAVLDDYLINAWRGVDEPRIRTKQVFAEAKATFSAVVNHPDPVIAYQGFAGLEAVKAIEAGGGMEESVPWGFIAVQQEPEFEGDYPNLEKEGGCGFVDLSGKVRIPLRYDEVDSFSTNGLAAVKQAGKWGFIDTTGAVVIPFQWEDTKGFDRNIAPVAKNGKWGLIDVSGREVAACQWEEFRDFRQGLAAVKLNGKFGFVDRAGMLVLPAQWDEVRDFDEGLAAVRKDGEWGFLDRNGTLLTLPWDLSHSHFSEGLAEVELADGKFGFINRRGELVFSGKGRARAWFSAGMTPVSDRHDDDGGEDGFVFVDRTGRQVLPEVWEDANAFCGGLAVVKRGLCGLMDRSGKLVVDLAWDDIFFLPSDGQYQVTKSDLEGVIDQNGAEIVAPEWDWLFHQNSHIEVYERLPEPVTATTPPLAVGEKRKSPARMLLLDRRGKVVWSSDGKAAVGEKPRRLHAPKAT